METKEINKAINGYGAITKEEADNLAKAAYTCLSIITGKYSLSPAEKETFEKCLDTLEVFMDLPM